MFIYILKRICQSVACLFVVITIIFLLLRLMPIEGYFNENYNKLSDEQIEAKLTKFGLNKPIYIQLFDFYKGVVKGDFGKSIKFRTNVPVWKIIVEKAPYSIKFGIVALIVQYAIGLPLGVMAAAYKGKLPDKICNGYIVLMRGVPTVVYLALIQLFFSKWFNLPMLYTQGELKSCILPVISMSVQGIAANAMWIRRFMVDELNKDYIKLERAKGVKTSAIMFKHVCKVGFLPLAQYLPVEILMTIGGALITEGLYSIPGMGGLLITSITNQDNFIVQAIAVIYSSIGIFGLLLGDLLMAGIDPRIKLNRKVGAR